MHCFSCQVSFCSSLSISPLQALGLFCCIGSGIDFHRLEVIAQDVLIARDVPALIVPQPSSGLVVVGRLGRGIVPVDVFHHISLLHMKRLVGDGVHGLLGSPAFQHRPGEHDLPGSSAVVAQSVLVERLDRDLCPVRHPQHGKLIGGQLLCQFGLAVQRRRSTVSANSSSDGSSMARHGKSGPLNRQAAAAGASPHQSRNRMV